MILMSAINKLIDHTALKPDITKQDIRTLCEEAIDYNFAAVCVNPCWVKYSGQLLNSSAVAVATVIGFPLGATTTQSKVFEAREAVSNGVAEIDMVMNIGMLKSGEDAAVQEDIRAVVDAVSGKALVKVIIETSLLNDDEKVRACKAAVAAGAHFVKTSTGFSGGGATVEDIKLMRETVGPDIGVKASGGIRDRAAAEAMIQAGATRIGASSGIAIVNGDEGTSGY
jgi:deoxyribose-phosphate aldolase